MNGRPAKWLIPSLKDRNRFDGEVRDRDAIEKFKGKVYADKRRNAKEGDLAVGDAVLLRNFGIRKLDPTFNPDPFTIVAIHGADVIVENEEGIRYRRHSSHTKKWTAQSTPIPSPDMATAAGPPVKITKEAAQSPQPQHQSPEPPENVIEAPRGRPKRVISKPVRYDAAHVSDD